MLDDLIQYPSRHRRAEKRRASAGCPDGGDGLRWPDTPFVQMPQRAGPKRCQHQLLLPRKVQYDDFRLGRHFPHLRRRQCRNVQQEHLRLNFTQPVEHSRTPLRLTDYLHVACTIQPPTYCLAKRRVVIHDSHPNGIIQGNPPSWSSPVAAVPVAGFFQYLINHPRFARRESTGLEKKKVPPMGYFSTAESAETAERKKKANQITECSGIRLPLGSDRAFPYTGGPSFLLLL